MVDRTGPKEGPRWELLTGGPFLIALGTLAANDWLLKALLHNTFTGKLSDFAGLFAFGIFVCALIPNRRRTALWTIAGAFVFWKSSFSQPVIDGWNSLGVLDVARVVDYGDLSALLVLPLAGYFVRVAPRPLRRPRVAGIAIAGVSLLVFAATSRPQEVVPYQEEYKLAIGLEDFAVLSDRLAETPDFSMAVEPGRMNVFLLGPCGLRVDLDLRGNDTTSYLRLTEILHYCPGEYTAGELLAEFEEDVLGRLERAIADDSIMMLVRLTERPRRQPAWRARYLRGNDQLLFGAERSSLVQGDSLYLIVGNLGSDRVEYDFCGIRRDLLRDGDWTPAGHLMPEGTRCYGARQLEPGSHSRTFVLLDDHWPAGTYRLRMTFRMDTTAKVVSTVPLVVTASTLLQPGTRSTTPAE